MSYISFYLDIFSFATFEYVNIFLGPSDVKIRVSFVFIFFLFLMHMYLGGTDISELSSKVQKQFCQLVVHCDSIITLSPQYKCVKMSADDRGIHNASCENRTPCVFPSQV